MTRLIARMLWPMADAETSAQAGRRTPSTATGLVVRGTDDERGGGLISVGHRKMQGRDAQRLRELAGRRVQQHARRPGVVEGHLDRTPGSRPHPDAKGLHHCLFGGKAGSEALGPSARVALLLLREETIRDTRMSLEREPKSRDVNDVDADAHRRHYSTVTVLARLRGRSTFLPSPRAME